MHTILKSYLKRLTNLSSNNRSLLLLRLSSDQDIDLHNFDYLSKQPSFGIIEKLIARKNKIALCDLLDSRNEKVNELSKRLKKISRREKFIQDERGAKDLYVGWPFVHGKFSDGTSVRCPLLFFPVELQMQDNHWVLVPREDESISFNKSFLLAYSFFNNIPLKDDFLETSLEELDKDSQVFRTSLYQILKDQLFVNFNQELFINKLLLFAEYKKADYEEKNKNGELLLQSEAVLGIFPQAGSYLVPDYEVLLKNNLFTDLEEFFLSRSNIKDQQDLKVFDYSFLNKIKEEQTFTPYKLDASQENAIKAMKKGNSLVVQGPPGTGKSQLICNLIADYIARGKRVLMVCQKRAALDVVHQRLKDKDLDDFTALVHDFKNDRRAIYAQINSQIGRLEEFKKRNNSFDSIQLERIFLQTSRHIDKLTEELEEFRKALYDESDCGISVKELYLISDPAADFIDIKQEFKYFKSNDIEKFSRVINHYLPYSLKFDKSDFLWNDRVSFKDFGVGDLKKINHFLDQIPFFQTQISEMIREILSASLDMDDLDWYLEREDNIKQMLYLLEDPRSYADFSYIINKNTDLDWLILRERNILECFKEEGVEETLTNDQLGDFEKALESAWQAKKVFYKWIWWECFSMDKYLVKRVFVGNKLKWNKEGFRMLMQKVDNRMNFEHNLTELKECGWLNNIPEDKKLQSFQEWFYIQHNALAAYTLLKELRGLKEYLNISSLSYQELKEKLTSFLDTIRAVPQERKMWSKYLTPRQISKILYSYEYAIELKEVLKDDFESLVEFDKLKENMLAFEKDTIKKLIGSSPGKDVKFFEKLFRNSVHLEWIEHIESKYPVLRSVSSLKMEQMETELQDSIKEKLRVSKDIVLLKVREKTLRDVDFNRLNNMVTYRDLKHQVSKKSKVWPLRKLIENFSEEIFNLVPCWMASPEAVSAIFPMQQTFDLVIFDEASQCFAEQGIPAMYRGRQVLIAGDDKQLSPNDLYKARWEDDTEEAPELEADSLLNLSEKYLMQVQLKGHYRSSSAELIEFSNKNFYKNTLRMLPHFNHHIMQEPPIKFINVKGVWENNANIREADEVAYLIEKLLKKEPKMSLGIVTFNFKQQTLIQDTLEVCQAKGKFEIPSSLFVKNIENVQGDERDIIIFSIGYAPDYKGRFIANFGSLNLPKGENRLNVAITRAKEKIFIISSITPEELMVENAKNEGPGFLKEYLRFAWKVSERNFKIPLKEPGNNRIDWFLNRRLEKAELKPLNLKEELPFVDITVKQGESYKGLILTDDLSYYESISAKEAHAYTPLIMQDKNWKYIKIFSRQYWENKGRIQEKISKVFMKG
jgi:DNA replication protein DnaC